MLRRLWDRFALGKRTWDEVARDFPKQLNVVKLVLHRWFSASLAEHYENQGQGDPKIASMMAAQVVNYLTGEPFDPSAPNLSPEVREFAEAIQADVPEIAANVMQQDRNLRETIVYTLRMRFILRSEVVENFLSTSEGALVSKLLHQYAAEFPEEVDERRFNALVATLARWSESPEFPGRDA